MKSTLRDIEARFDKDVERFSNLQTGQQTTLDAAFNMELITEAISRCYPKLKSVLDLSQAMINKDVERVRTESKGKVDAHKGDFRDVDFRQEKFDVIIATAVLHHLRDDNDWETAFHKLFDLLKEGGSLWVFDLIQQS